MKRIYFTALIIFVVTFNINAQNCKTPMSSQSFQSIFTQIASQQGDEMRFSKAVNLLGNNCYSASQVKTVAMVYSSETFRLDYCKLAYQYLADKENVYDIYDAFGKYSTAFKFFDYVHTLTPPTTQTTPTITPHVVNTPTTTPTPTVPATPSANFPAYTYPAHTNYNGQKGCNGPVLGDIEFNTMALDLSKQNSDDSKSNIITLASTYKCFSMEQAMKLASLISNEGARYKMMTSLFSHLYDLGNYDYAKVVFPTATVQANWMKFCMDYFAPPCNVNDVDFAKIQAEMKKKPFGDDKIKVFQTASKDRCFSVDQLKALAKQFSFDDYKMDMFKSSYAKCTNRKDYYLLIDEITFQSKKDELKSFIEKN